MVNLNNSVFRTSKAQKRRQPRWIQSLKNTKTKTHKHNPKHPNTSNPFQILFENAWIGLAYFCFLRLGVLWLCFCFLFLVCLSFWGCWVFFCWFWSLFSNVLGRSWWISLQGPISASPPSPSLPSPPIKQAAKQPAIQPSTQVSRQAQPNENAEIKRRTLSQRNPN